MRKETCSNSGQVVSSVLTGFVKWCTHISQVGVSVFAHDSVFNACSFMYMYVQYVGVSHTPAGLWSPESEEDKDKEQRRLLAAPQP